MKLFPNPAKGVFSDVYDSHKDNWFNFLSLGIV